MFSSHIYFSWERFASLFHGAEWIGYTELLMEELPLLRDMDPEPPGASDDEQRYSAIAHFKGAVDFIPYCQ